MDSNESSRNRTRPERSRRKPGGQPACPEQSRGGNQNARTHGLRSKHLSPENHRLLQAAAGLSELDYEIALLRAKVLSILADEPDNHRMLLLAILALIKALQARQLHKDSSEELSGALRNALGDVAPPAGIELLIDIIAPSSPSQGSEIKPGI